MSALSSTGEGGKNEEQTAQVSCAALGCPNRPGAYRRVVDPDHGCPCHRFWRDDDRA